MVEESLKFSCAVSMFNQLTNALYQCRQKGGLPTVREKMSLFQGSTALPLELHFHVVRSCYNVKCWIWKIKHFFLLLFLPQIPWREKEKSNNEIGLWELWYFTWTGRWRKDREGRCWRNWGLKSSGLKME